jgi:hypothetical protein
VLQSADPGDRKLVLEEPLGAAMDGFVSAARLERGKTKGKTLSVRRTISAAKGGQENGPSGGTAFWRQTSVEKCTEKEV